MANVPTTAWSETTPAGSDQINAGDNRIRELKTQIREVIAVDHDFPSSGQATDNGQHLRVTLQEQADLGTGAVGTTILGSQTINGKGELVYTDESDTDVQITKDAKLHAPSLAGVYPAANVAALATMMNLIYPVGYVITLGVSTNPATLLGIGTWTAIAGKVIVGIDGTQTEFDTLNETGGANTVTLTAAQSGLPSHTHTTQHYTLGDAGASAGFSTQTANAQTLNSDYVTATVASNAAEAHSNLQPYIVKYVWERTA
jgi:hypothetical protein